MGYCDDEDDHNHGAVDAHDVNADRRAIALRYHSVILACPDCPSVHGFRPSVRPSRTGSVRPVQSIRPGFIFQTPRVS